MTRLDGDLELTIRLDGELGEFQKVHTQEYYTGDYVVTPLANESVVLPTEGLIMSDDVTVLQVPYYQTANQYGDTVYIAEEV